MGKRLVNVDVKVNADAIRAAASNAANLNEVAIEVPVVDPRDLSIDDQIYAIKLKPINDKAKKGPNTALLTAIDPIIVETLSGRVKPGFITVNGTIDISKEPGRVTKLENSFFISEDDARAVCRVVTEVDLERSLARQKEEKENSDFLMKQLEDDRF